MVLAAARPTIFHQFVAGESISDVHAVAQRLQACGVRCIVDHSVEELDAEHERQKNLEAKLGLLGTLSSELGTACSFVPIKLTSLISPTLLERLTDGSRAEDGDSLDGATQAASLSATERAELGKSVDGLRELCGGAARAGVPILLDAEQTHRQPAIRLIARELAREFNSSSSSSSDTAAAGVDRCATSAHGTPIVFDTHQAYLVGAAERLAAELEHARRGGYTLAVKLVRGAYRHGEAQRDVRALQPSKEHTDDEYDRCARLLLDAATEEAPRAAVLLATHNRPSIEAVTSTMRERGLPLTHPRVHFAQILGMADDLTLSLGLDGFNAHKLTPYGKFSEVLPWLLRRLEENHDALGAAADERPLLRAELGRRLLGLGMAGSKVRSSI